MKVMSSSRNSSLFKEAEMLKKSIHSEIHCKATNKKDTVLHNKKTGFKIQKSA